MIFTELRFVAFFALVLVLHWWVLRGLRARKAMLLVASYAFYAAWDPRFLSLIVVSTLVDWIAGARIHRATTARGRRTWLGVSLAVNLGLLGTYKYLDFFIGSAAELLVRLGFEPNLPLLELALPVGISFYTFQTLSYSLDIHAGRLEPVEELLDLATFVAFFPQLVAGPIVRASDFLPQLRAPREFPYERVRGLLLLFLVGFFKKACVSDNITEWVKAFYEAPETYDCLGTWTGMLLFSVQIYCDFSGYSDMAIACAGLLGYELRLNFDFPYLRANIQEFWRTWHMSLSHWLRDYVYVPLGGNRGGRWATNRNLLWTMLIAGIWHGAGWTFVLFGLVHGVGLVAYRELTRLRPAPAHPSLARTALACLANFAYVTWAWVFFAAPDLASAWTVTRGALGVPGATSALVVPHAVAGPLALVGALAVLHLLARGRVVARWLDAAPAWAFAVAYGAAFPVVLSLMNGVVQPFIYFQF